MGTKFDWFLVTQLLFATPKKKFNRYWEVSVTRMMVITVTLTETKIIDYTKGVLVTRDIVSIQTGTVILVQEGSEKKNLVRIVIPSSGYNARLNASNPSIRDALSHHFQTRGVYYCAAEKSQFLSCTTLLWANASFGAARVVFEKMHGEGEKHYDIEEMGSLDFAWGKETGQARLSWGDLKKLQAVRVYVTFSSSIFRSLHSKGTFSRLEAGHGQRNGGPADLYYI